MPIRICHISTVHPASDVRIFHRECCSLARAGFEVHLVIPAETSSLQNGVHLHAIRGVTNRVVRMLVMPWVAWSIALRTKSGIYHFHDPELIPVAFLVRWILRKRVVYDVHEAVAKQIMSKQWLPPWSRRIISAAYRLVERLLTPGQVIVLANENCVPDYASSAYLVRNYPLLLDSIQPAAGVLSGEASCPLLVYVGGVSHDRGGMVYVQLAHELLRRGHDFRMKIVGPHTDDYGRLLSSRIAEFGLGDRVSVTGRMDYAAAMEIVNQATIGMCLLLPVPNYTTCLATKILEYMMFGTPVLVSDFDAWRPYVEGERVGLMVNPVDIDGVATACEKMLADPDELRAMGRRGMEAVRARYNWASEFATLQRCYADLLANRGQ